MNLKISFRHLEHTHQLDEMIKAKSKKLEKYFDGNFDLQWTCYVQEGKHTAEIKLLGPSFEYHAKANSDIMYKTIDKVVHKIEKQVKKKKSRWKDHITQKHTMTPKTKLILEDEKREENVIQEVYDEAS